MHPGSLPDRGEITMKKKYKSLNVNVKTASGYLDYSYFPETQDFVEDVIVLLNDSMPHGDTVG